MTSGSLSNFMVVTISLMLNPYFFVVFASRPQILFLPRIYMIGDLWMKCLGRLLMLPTMGWLVSGKKRNARVSEMALSMAANAKIPRHFHLSSKHAPIKGARPLPINVNPNVKPT